MKNTDIEVGRTYIATPGYSGPNRFAHSKGAKVVALETGVALPNNRIGHRGVRVRFERPHRAGYRGDYEQGQEAVLPSVQIHRLWTDEDEQRGAAKDAAGVRQEQIRQDLLNMGFRENARYFHQGTEVPDNIDRRVMQREREGVEFEVEPQEFHVTGARTPDDVSVTFTSAGYDKLNRLINGG